MDQPLGNSASGNSSSLLDDHRIEQLLIEVGTLGRRFAAEFMWRENVEDVAQQVVLDCLIEMREGRWDISDDGLPGFVHTMVERRAVDFLRTRQRREARERAHTRELAAGVPAWMSPEVEYEEEELRALQERTLALIPLACRRAYLMVRDAHMSYDAVAANLGVSRSAVTSYIVRAQRRFRQELERQGIQARYRNGRPAPTERDSLGWRRWCDRRGR